MEKEKEHFAELITPQRFHQLQDRFEKTPDELKPFYSIQLAYVIAEREKTLRKQVESSTASKAAVRKLAESERLELERLRGKKKLKERQRQQKKRSRSSKKK